MWWGYVGNGGMKIREGLHCSNFFNEMEVV